MNTAGATGKRHPSRSTLRGSYVDAVGQCARSRLPFAKVSISRPSIRCGSAYGVNKTVFRHTLDGLIWPCGHHGAASPLPSGSPGASGSWLLSNVISTRIPVSSIPFFSQYWATKAPMQLPSEATKSWRNRTTVAAPIPAGTSMSTSACRLRFKQHVTLVVRRQNRHLSSSNLTMKSTAPPTGSGKSTQSVPTIPDCCLKTSIDPGRNGRSHRQHERSSPRTSIRTTSPTSGESRASGSSDQRSGGRQEPFSYRSPERELSTLDHETRLIK